MALELPRTLTPSKVTAFTNCPLAFRFSVIEHRPEPSSPHAVKGTLVHSALEGLFWNHAPAGRTRAAAGHELARAWTALGSDPEFMELGLGSDDAASFLSDAETLIDNYFRLEDPTTVHTIAVELGVEIESDGMRLRGIIDRLDIGPDGALTVVDYKTGRAPSERYEQGKMGGVQTYALLCEKVLGRAPVEVRLLHLPRPGGHLGRRHTPDDTRATAPHLGGVERHRAGLCERGLPPQGGTSVPVLPFQAVVPRVQCRLRRKP